jgi:hypothetical protein
MSLTLTQMKTRIRILTGELVDAGEAEVLLQDRYSELLDNYSWSQAKNETTINTIPQRGDGTIAISSGTPTLVQGTGTSFSTNDVGGFFRVGTDIGFLKVNNVDPVGQILTLEAPYPNPPVASGSSYTLFFTFYTMPADLRRIDNMVEWFDITEWSVDDLMRADPQRTFTGSDPLHFVYRGLAANNCVQIELWPIPTGAVTVRIPYYKRVSPLTEIGTASDTGIIPSSLLMDVTMPDALALAIVKEKDQKKLMALSKVLDRAEAKATRSLEEAQHMDLGLQGAIRKWMPMGRPAWMLDDFLPVHDAESFGLP